MNTPVPKIVGSTPVRIAAVGAVGLCFLFATGLIPCGGAVRLAAFACGVFAFIGIIFSFVSLFKAWMRFGQTLNKCVSIFLFSLVYIFFVPFFFILYRFIFDSRRRGRLNIETFWCEKHNKPLDLDFFKRMG